MADSADLADKNFAVERDIALQQISDQAQNIPVGNAGDCDLCGEWFSRLVNGACGRCRDKYGLD